MCAMVCVNTCVFACVFPQSAFMCVCVREWSKGHHLDTCPCISQMIFLAWTVWLLVGKHVFVIFYMIIRCESGKHCGSHRATACVCVGVCNFFLNGEALNGQARICGGDKICM